MGSEVDRNQLTLVCIRPALLGEVDGSDAPSAILNTHLVLLLPQNEGVRVVT